MGRFAFAFNLSLIVNYLVLHTPKMGRSAICPSPQGRNFAPNRRVVWFAQSCSEFAGLSMAPLHRYHSSECGEQAAGTKP